MINNFLSSASPQMTFEQRLERIKVMSQRINTYIDFMCQMATTDTTSTEVREKAITAFHDRMVIVEKQLHRIQEDFRLE